MPSSASIRSRLLNIAKKENRTFQQIAFRYFHERFLARLSVSMYRDNLLLKGGNFIYAHHGNTARPTIDIDFLGDKISNNTVLITQIIKSICLIKLDDSIFFNPQTIKSIAINDQKEYHGTRLIVEVTFDSMKENIQIDIGFGDIVTPQPIYLNYPVLLPEFENPYILSYNIETAVAEKIHAIFTLAGFNSRIKDYYDVYIFVSQNQCSSNQLWAAINATFKARKTKFELSTLNQIIRDYASRPKNKKMWELFLNKISVTNIPLEVVAEIIVNKLNLK